MAGALGGFNHLTLSVSDFAKSTEFYNTILTRLGYDQVKKLENFILWVHPQAGGVAIVPIKPDFKDVKHNRYSCGLNHIAFNATSKEEVDKFHDFLVEKGYNILDAPAEYSYTPGYYAVFWSCPDEMKLELVHIPGWLKPPGDTAEETAKEKEPEGKDHDGNGATDENETKRRKTEE